MTITMLGTILERVFAALTGALFTLFILTQLDRGDFLREAFWVLAAMVLCAAIEIIVRWHAKRRERHVEGQAHGG